MLNRAKSPGFIEDKGLESLTAYMSQTIDSSIAQVQLWEEIEVHNFLLFLMSTVNPSWFTGWKIAVCEGILGASEEVAHNGHISVHDLGWDQDP
jgi:hypothetical protein